MCDEIGVKIDNKHRYDHVSKSVETSDEGKAMEPTVQTDTTKPNNKSGIIIRDNKNGTCMSTDVVMSRHRNVIKPEAEKILQHEDLTTEVQRIGM
jgi:hypothetical protein